MSEPTYPIIPSVSPHLVCDDAAAAVEFYKSAFGAVEMMRLPGPDGRIMHASVLMNGGMVMLVDSNPAWGARSPKALGGTPVTLHLFAPDADALAARAVAAGATTIMPVAEQFWGDRYGIVEDPFGHRWSIATPVRKPSVAEINAAARAAFAQGCPDAGQQNG